MSILRFLGSLNPNFKILNRGSNIADRKFEIFCIFIKMSILRFLGVLNSNMKIVRFLIFDPLY